jgi:cytochrome c-type biogenesis protein CcmH
MKRWIALLLLALAVGSGWAKEAEPLADDPAVEQRLINIADEMRCLVCQNESLASSRADLAVDLRKELREQIRLGRTDDEIREFMVSRYGDFVLYRPRVKPVTWLLWAGPFVLMIAGVVVLMMYLRRRNRVTAQAATLSQDESSRAEALLKEAEL